MKRIGIIALSLLFTGAGCFGGSSSAANDGGVFRSNNAGEDWSQIVLVPTAAGVGTLATTDVLNMEVDPQDSSFMYIGTRQNGMLYSEDAGQSWRQPRFAQLQEGTIFNIEVNPQDVCELYVAKGQRLYRSADCMRSFDDEAYVETRSGVTVVQVAVDWFDPRTVWIGLNNGDVLRSEDAGRSWRTVLKTGNEISGIAINNTDSRKVLISTFNNGFYKTVNAGEDWKDSEDALEDLDDADEVFFMTQTANSSVVLATSEYGLLRSEDFGDTWEEIPLVTAPGEVLIRSVAVVDEDPDRLYYAANGTFYKSADGGETWNTERLPTSRIVRAMAVDPEDASVVYIGVASPLN